MTSTETTPHAPAGLSGHLPVPGPGLQSLIHELFTEAGPIFDAIRWAEEEIAAAQLRHPGQADAIWHAFAVVKPRDIRPGMGTEFVYRGHVRELLDRVAAGADLRPATAAEIVLTLADISLRVPFHGPGAGLYFRMWQQAFPDSELTAEFAINLGHYEHLHGAQIDALEVDLRHKVRDPDRLIGDISCGGHHHGKPVNCMFAER